MCECIYTYLFMVKNYLIYFTSVRNFIRKNIEIPKFSMYELNRIHEFETQL